MNLKEFNEFFHFFRSEIKLYHNGYNILVGYDVYTISDIIWNDWNGNGRNGRWAQLSNVLCILSIDSITNLSFNFAVMPPKIPLF